MGYFFLIRLTDLYTSSALGQWKTLLLVWMANRSVRINKYCYIKSSTMIFWVLKISVNLYIKENALQHITKKKSTETTYYAICLTPWAFTGICLWHSDFRSLYVGHRCCRYSWRRTASAKREKDRTLNISKACLWRHPLFMICVAGNNS